MGVPSAAWILLPGVAWTLVTALAPPRLALTMLLSAFTTSLLVLVLVPERRLRRLMALVELRPSPAQDEGARAYAAAYATARATGEDEAKVRAVLARAADAFALTEEEARRIERDVERKR